VGSDISRTLGEELKKLRKDKKMTLKELSVRSGLSISFISQIERDLKTLTFTSLKKISEALDVNVNFFFDDNQAAPVDTSSLNGNFSYKNLSGAIENPIFTPAFVELKAGETQHSPYTHRGQEFIYVLDGSLEVIINGEQETLITGESIHIDSRVEHEWYNDTEEPTKILLVSSNSV